MYDLRRLRSLCAIADHGSLTAAADALTFTQPAVSQHLAALEAEVGAPLVTRSRGGAELTDAGRLLVEHARAALDRLALAEVQVSDLVAHEQRRVRLAGHSSSLTRLIPLAVADLRRRLPDAEVTIREAGPPRALDALRNGDVDLAVMFRREGIGGARRRRRAPAARGVDVRRRPARAPARRRAASSSSPACATTPGSRARARPRPG